MVQTSWKHIRWSQACHGFRSPTWVPHLLCLPTSPAGLHKIEPWPSKPHLSLVIEPPIWTYQSPSLPNTSWEGVLGMFLGSKYLFTTTWNHLNMLLMDKNPAPLGMMFFHVIPLIKGFYPSKVFTSGAGYLLSTVSVKMEHHFSNFQRET